MAYLSEIIWNAKRQRQKHLWKHLFYVRINRQAFDRKRVDFLHTPTQHKWDLREDWSCCFLFMDYTHSLWCIKQCLMQNGFTCFLCCILNDLFGNYVWVDAFVADCFRARLHLFCVLPSIKKFNLKWVESISISTLWIDQIAHAFVFSYPLSISPSPFAPTFIASKKPFSSFASAISDFLFSPPSIHLVQLILSTYDVIFFQRQRNTRY